MSSAQTNSPDGKDVKSPSNVTSPSNQVYGGVLIIGNSGVGKSLLVNLLAGSHVFAHKSSATRFVSFNTNLHSYFVLV